MPRPIITLLLLLGASLTHASASIPATNSTTWCGSVLAPPTEDITTVAGEFHVPILVENAAVADTNDNVLSMWIGISGGVNNATVVRVGADVWVCFVILYPLEGREDGSWADDGLNLNSIRRIRSPGPGRAAACGTPTEIYRRERRSR
jgi:hypothetical protein